MDYTEPQQFSVWTGPENDVFGFRSVLLRARVRGNNPFKAARKGNVGRVKGTGMQPERFDGKSAVFDGYLYETLANLRLIRQCLVN